MKIAIKISVFTLSLVFLAGTIAVAADEKPATEKKARKPRAEMTAQELADSIKDMVESEDEILDFVPGLASVKKEDGSFVYSYEGVLLENVDKEKLQKLFSRVSNERTRIRTDKLNRQMESIRQANQAARAQAVNIPQQPPKVQTPPQVQQPPRIPNPPPQPPQTRR